METRYGKVYELHRDSAADGKEIIKSKLLESTFFSNIDFKWYDSAGNLSPFYEKYKGRSFAVQFNLNQKDKNGQQVELSGKIHLPYKLGEIGHQDFESVAESKEEMTELWRNCGVFPDDVLNDDGYNTVENAHSASFVAALCPGWKISDIRTFYVWMEPFFILDDHMDKSASQKDVAFKTSNLYWSALTSVVEGKPLESEVAQKLSELPKQYLKLMKGMEEVRKLIMEKKGDPTHIFQACKDFHDALSIENCMEWQKKRLDPASKMYAETQPLLRNFTIGIPLTLEVILFDKQIQISEKVRESFLFKSILDACSKHVYLINDLFSLKKEMDVDTTSNMVHIWHHRDGLSLPDAYEKAVNAINLLEQVVNENGELLIQFFGEEGAKVANGHKDIIYGNVQWHGITTRYHSEFIYHCIVEPE